MPLSGVEVQAVFKVSPVYLRDALATYGHAIPGTVSFPLRAFSHEARIAIVDNTQSKVFCGSLYADSVWFLYYERGSCVGKTLELPDLDIMPEDPIGVVERKFMAGLEKFLAEKRAIQERLANPPRPAGLWARSRAWLES